MRNIGTTERWLMVVIALICLFLALTTDTFFTLVNLFDLLNISAVNVIFAASPSGKLVSIASLTPSAAHSAVDGA